MKRIEIPERFDIDIFSILRDGLDSHIIDTSNIIGSSQIAFCPKKIVIGKLNKFEFISNAKMLMGQIFENELYKSEVLSRLIFQINNDLGIMPNDQIIETQAQKFLELIPGYFFRITPDVYTNYYMIEVKTTAIYAREWKRELAAYQVVQLNTQLGAFSVDLGFVLKVNTRAFLSNIKQDEEYWNTLWQKYGYFLPWYFDEKTYENTLNRAKWLLECIRDEVIPKEDNVFSWECDYCNEGVRKICGKEEYKCSAPKCYKKMYMYPKDLTQKFKSFVMCEKCFKKENPRSKYEKYKLINYKEMK